jgi:hypothetical protein
VTTIAIQPTLAILQLGRKKRNFSCRWIGKNGWVLKGKHGKTMVLAEKIVFSACVFPSTN